MRVVFCLLTFFLVFTSCEKEFSNNQQAKPEQNNGTLPLADTSLITDTTIFFDVVVNGERQLQIQPLNNYSVYWAGIVAYVSGSYGLYEQGITGNINQGLVLFNGISLQPNDTTFLLKNERMFNGFEPGSYSYTAISYQSVSNKNGVQIHWIDTTGKTWGSEFGTADQTGSAFQILDRVNEDPSYNTTGMTHFIYIRCAFNCSLYDSIGRRIELKNGRMGVSVWL